MRLSASARSTDWIALDYQLKLGGGALTYSADQANAVTFDAQADKVFQLASSTYTFNVTVNDHNARYLRVNVGITSGSKTVSSIKRATSGADQNLSLLTSVANGTYRAEIWELIAPAVGTFAVTVTLSGACDSRPTALVYYGVHQTTPSEATATATGTNGGSPANATVNVTTIADQDWISDCCASDDNFGTIAAVTGQTTHQDPASTVSGSMGSTDTNSPESASSTTAMAFTGIGAGQKWAICAAAIRPLSAVAATTFTATGSISTGSATLAASCTFAPGTHTAAGSLTAGHSTIAASCTFSPGTHTAAAALVAGHVTIAAAATFSPGTHTAIAALTTGPATLAASALFASAVRIASAALTAQRATIAAAATFSPGTHTATAILTLQPCVLAALAVGAPLTQVYPGAVTHTRYGLGGVVHQRAGYAGVTIEGGRG